MKIWRDLTRSLATLSIKGALTTFKDCLEEIREIGTPRMSSRGSPCSRCLVGLSRGKIPCLGCSGDKALAAIIYRWGKAPVWSTLLRNQTQWSWLISSKTRRIIWRPRSKLPTLIKIFRWQLRTISGKQTRKTTWVGSLERMTWIKSPQAAVSRRSPSSTRTKWFKTRPLKT